MTTPADLTSGVVDLAGGVAANDESVDHLLARLALVHDRIRGEVARRRRVDPSPDDPFRGLYLSDEHVDHLLSDAEPVALLDPAQSARVAELDEQAGAAERAGADIRLLRLAREHSLSPLDVELLLVALAPELDSRFERLYGYLNDDVTRKRASAALALELCGLPMSSPTGRSRLQSGAPLVDRGLLVVEDSDRPFPTRGLRVPDRVSRHLLGSDQLDPYVADIVTELSIPLRVTLTGLAEALRSGVRLVYVQERVGHLGRCAAATALADAGRRALDLDLHRLTAGGDASGALAVLAREAKLLGAGIVAAPLEALLDRGDARPDGRHDSVVRALMEMPVPVLVCGQGAWDPAWSVTVPLITVAPTLSSEQRASLWAQALDAGSSGVENATAHFELSPHQISRAARAAQLQALLSGTPVGPHDVRAGARSQNHAGLERLARRLEPSVGWADLVLPSVAMGQLHDLAARARNRERVLGEWGMRPGGGRGRGITALFAGDSGTGKTMSAEVIAAELGLDLYTVNLATLVDKYIGETEKNLERVFSAAAGVNGVLLFDEADAIFGRRSEVKDAHDRYANIESAYLLQRMETFDGIAILATNLRSNIDDAFTRRLDLIIDFPTPDEEHREKLWRRCLARAPQDDELDIPFCAKAFELSGGNIRSIAVTAAYLAADAERPLVMADLIRATQQEYRKMGRLCLPSEFGRYFDLLAD